MTTIQYQSGAAVTLNGMGADYDFSYDIIENPTLVSPGTVTATVADAVIATSTSAGSDANFSIEAHDSMLHGAGVTLENLTPAICSLTGNAVTVVEPSGNGTASIALHGVFGTKTFSRTFARGITSYRSLSGFLTGSLARHISDNIATMTSGKTPGANTQDEWTAVNWSVASPSATRNPNLFTGALDLTFIALANSNSDNSRVFKCSLISPRHAISASHITGGVGTVLKWRANDGTIYSATVQATQAVVDSSGVNADITVLYLDQAINSAITPAYFLPATWQTYLPTFDKNAHGTVNGPVGSGMYWANSLATIPGLVRTANSGTKNPIYTNSSHIRIMDFSTKPDFLTPTRNWLQIELSDLYPTWDVDIYGGDSGSMMFFPINNGGTLRPVLVASMWTASGGVFYGNLITPIEAAMNALRSGGDVTNYSLTKIPLAGLFNTY